MVMLAGVRFKRASKVYDFDSNGLDLKGGDMVIVEVEKGMGMGIVVSRPREVDPATITRKLKKVIRVADDVDMERHGFNNEREEEAYRVCKEKIAEHKLPMKLVNVEYLFDSSKAIFYFTSDSRVDFRELVKDLASGFHTRIEMRQIGVRDEAKMLGGLGPCGRELCCSGFLSDFEPVTIKMAKEQNLALNPTKISGICGRLMCCLGYEYSMYKEERIRRRAEAARPVAAGESEARACGSCGKHGAPCGHAGAPEGGDEAGRAGGPRRDRGPRQGGGREGARGARPGASRERRFSEATEGAPPIGQEADAPPGPVEPKKAAEGSAEGEAPGRKRSRRGRRRRGRDRRPRQEGTDGQGGQGGSGSGKPGEGGGKPGEGGGGGEGQG